MDPSLTWSRPQFLGSFRYRGQKVESHMVIVAASTPNYGSSGSLEALSWYTLPLKFTEVSMVA